MRIASFPRHNESLLTDWGWQYLLGELELTNGCLRVRPFPTHNALIGDPDSYLMLWPANFSVSDEGGDVRVIGGSGIIKAWVGVTLRVSGGRWHKENVPQELLSSIPEACHEYGYYWQVGDEVSSLGPSEPTAISIPGSTLFFPRSRTRIEAVLHLAEAEGELVLDGNCLRIGGEDGHTIVWPPGFTPHIEDGVIEVRNGGGKTIARVGDYLVLGGREAGEARGNDKSIPCTGTFWDDTSFGSITRNGREVGETAGGIQTPPAAVKETEVAEPPATEVTLELKPPAVNPGETITPMAVSGGPNTAEPESGGTPSPEGVSPALAQDARMYADDFGVSLEEALTRLILQGPAGELSGNLEANEADTFAGLWIQHEPEFRVIVMFTRNSEKTIRPYIEDGPLEEIVEVRNAETTLLELQRSQTNANKIVTGLGFRVASGINVFENRVELYATDAAQLEAALTESGLTLPAHVQIIAQ